jgi:hypothetical protein
MGTYAKPPAADTFKTLTGQASEPTPLSLREIYLYFAEHMSESKPKTLAAENRIASNVNTIAKLAEMAAAR